MLVPLSSGRFSVDIYDVHQKEINAKSNWIILLYKWDNYREICYNNSIQKANKYYTMKKILAFKTQNYTIERGYLGQYVQTFTQCGNPISNILDICFCLNMFNK